MNQKIKRQIIRYALAAILLLVVVGMGLAYYIYTSVQSPNVQLPNNKETVDLYIYPGESYNAVKRVLINEGWLKDTLTFEWVAKKKNYHNLVKPGRYLIRNGMSNNDLINMLRAGEQTPVNVTFNNISTLQQLAGNIAHQIEPDSVALLKAITNEMRIRDYGFNLQTAGAMYIPDTYEFYWTTDADKFVEKMHRAYLQFWNDDRKAKVKKLNLTPIEVVTLASIVEAETKHADEMPIVAGLYVNRLRKGMRLQSDPTVKFALNEPDRKRIYKADLNIESPYNTYIYTGLPPGPIGFPSKTAIDAVLNYKTHKHLYMCAQPNYSGYHNFANSYNQHLANRNKYTRFLRKEGIR